MLHSMAHRMGRPAHTHTMRAFSVALVRPSLVVASCSSVASSGVLGVLVRSLHSRTKSPQRQLMGRSFTGIFAGKHIAYGNMVSHSERKTRRTWKPNVHRKAFWSDVLGRELTIKVTTAALRTFDKYGGMDRYLLRSPLHRLDEGKTRALRLSMELKLLADPRLAQDLHLEDVLARMCRPSEVKRIRRETIARQDWARSVGHLNHGVLTAALPDGTIPRMEPLTDEVAAQRQQWLQERRNAKYHARKALRAAGPSESLRARMANGILMPKNRARQAVKKGQDAKDARYKRATFKNPFTQPTRAIIIKAKATETAPTA